MKTVRLLMLLCSLSSLSHAKVILWDLGGILFEPHKFGVAQEVGLSYFLSHAVLDLRSPNIQQKLFDLLDQLEPRKSENNGVAGSATGLPLPTIMCRWQAGAITGAEIIKKADSLISFLYTCDYFDSKEQMVLFRRCIKAMFTPEILVRNVSPIQEGIDLLIASSRMLDKQGKKLHRHFVFSNWDHLSFDLFRNLYGHIFKFFEQIVISGHIKKIKPHAEAYRYLIETYNLTPSECVLIDDQEANARAARKAGMKAVVLRNRDYGALKHDLRALGVLE